MKPDPLRVEVVRFTAELERTHAAYDDAFERWFAAPAGTRDEAYWRAVASRLALESTSCYARLARARAEAEGRRWLQAVDGARQE